MSWRAGGVGEDGSWPDELPVSFEGDSMVVLTSVEPGGNFTLDVTDLSDDCAEDETAPNARDAVEQLCDNFCDPSTYYWEPLQFGT